MDPVYLHAVFLEKLYSKKRLLESITFKKPTTICDINKHKNQFNSTSLVDAELKCDVLVTEAGPQHKWVQIFI